MTQRETCTCTEPEPRVYKTIHTPRHKVQYMRCKRCGKLTENKRIDSELVHRITVLEALVAELRKFFKG